MVRINGVLYFRGFMKDIVEKKLKNNFIDGFYSHAVLLL